MVKLWHLGHIAKFIFDSANITTNPSFTFTDVTFISCNPNRFSCSSIFKFIFLLVFTGKNLFRTLDSKNTQISFAKDTVYRFLNSANFNWRKFLFLLSSSIIKNEIEPLTSEDRVNVLIVDD